MKKSITMAKINPQRPIIKRLPDIVKRIAVSYKQIEIDGVKLHVQDDFIGLILKLCSDRTIITDEKLAIKLLELGLIDDNFWINGQGATKKLKEIKNQLIKALSISSPTSPVLFSRQETKTIKQKGKNHE